MSRTHTGKPLKRLLYTIALALITLPVSANLHAENKTTGEQAKVTQTAPPPKPNAADKASQLLDEARTKALNKQREVEAYLQDTSNTRWLTSESGEKFLMLYRADQTGESHGLVLLLHGEAQHLAAQPLESLRTGLPEEGWSTLSIGLLADPNLFRAYNAPTPNTQSGTKTETEKASDDGYNGGKTSQAPKSSSATVTVPAFPELSTLSENFQQRLTATLPIIAEKAPQRLVVIAFDISGLWLFEALAQNIPLQGLSAAILIDAYQPEQLQQFDLTQAAINSPLALFDIIVTRPEAKIHGQLRRIRAQQTQRSNYRYLKLPHQLHTEADQTRFVHRLAAWLKMLKRDNRR